MRISRVNYIRSRLDDPALAEAFGQEWDEQEAAWLASLPSDTPALSGYLASLPEPWRRTEFDPVVHGSRDEVEAAAAAWSRQEAAAAAERDRLESLAARAEAARVEAEAARSLQAEKVRTQRLAELEADERLIDEVAQAGEMSDVMAALVRIAKAGLERMRA